MLSEIRSLPFYCENGNELRAHCWNPVRLLSGSAAEDFLEVLTRLPPITFNPFNPEFTIVIFIHYKPRIVVAILDFQWMKMT